MNEIVGNNTSKMCGAVKAKHNSSVTIDDGIPSDGGIFRIAPKMDSTLCKTARATSNILKDVVFNGPVATSVNVNATCVILKGFTIRKFKQTVANNAVIAVWTGWIMSFGGTFNHLFFNVIKSHIINGDVIRIKFTMDLYTVIIDGTYS